MTRLAEAVFDLRCGRRKEAIVMLDLASAWREETPDQSFGARLADILRLDPMA